MHSFRTSFATWPRVVSAAVLLLAANLVLFTAYDLVSLHQDPETSHDTMLVMYGVHAVSVTVELALIALIARAVNWARYAYGSIVVIFLAHYWYLPGTSGSTVSVLESIENWLNPMLQVAATILLFTKPASAWFKKSREKFGAA